MLRYQQFLLTHTNKTILIFGSNVGVEMVSMYLVLVMLKCKNILWGERLSEPFNPCCHSSLKKKDIGDRVDMTCETGETRQF